jgi:hypothetical protein
MAPSKAKSYAKSGILKVGQHGCILAYKKFVVEHYEVGVEVHHSLERALVFEPQLL